MASYASSATATNEDDADALTITKPTGLAAGDMLLAILGASGQSTLFALSGWGTLISNTGSTTDLTVLWKIATADDAAASNFTFTHGDTSTVSRAGILYRITGTFGGAGNFVSVTDSDTVAVAGYSPGVTPSGSTALLVMGAITTVQGTTTSAYAVINNNPTWTERCDLSVNGAADITLSSATGDYASGADTGDFHMTFSGTVDSRSYLIALSDSANVTATPAVVTMTAAAQAPSVAGGATVTVSAPVTMASSTLTPSVAISLPTWTNPDKSSAPSWSNPNKS